MPAAIDSMRPSELPILVAEDDRVNQRVIARQLALLGHAVVLVDDGRQALEKWRSGRYALLLTDLQMPLMDGFALARIIRHSERTGGQRLPILALTGTDTANAMAAGMDACLGKPIQMQALDAALRRWLPQRPVCVELAAATDAMAPAPEPAADSHIDIGVLRNLVGDDPIMLDSLLDDFSRSVSQMRAAMIAAHASGDAVQCLALAHRLKSSARVVGADALARVCIAIERPRAMTSDQDAIDIVMRSFLQESEAVIEAVSRQLAQRANA